MGHFFHKKPLNIYVILLIVLCLFHLVSNLTWLSLSSAPLPWDQAGHTRLALGFVNFFSSYEVLKIVNYFSVSNYYPPLIHTIVALFIMIFGHPVFIGGLIIAFFFIASIVFIYKYFTQLFESKLIGLLSSAIFSFFPIVFEHSRWFLLEIPLLAFVFASLFYLLRSNYFTDKKNTFLFFVFTSLALMTKWLALVYLFIPFLISLHRFLKKDRQIVLQSLNSIKNGLFLLFGITLPWYLINIHSLFTSASVNLGGESSDPQGILTLRNWIFYLYTLINFQITFFISIVFLVAIIVYILSKDKNKALILGSTLFIYIFFSLVPNKDWRYTLPILPFVSAIVAYLIAQIQKKLNIIGYFIIFIILAFQATYFLLLSFRFPVHSSYQKAFNAPFIGWVDYVNINDNLAHAVNSSIWPQKEILEEVNSSSPEKILILCLVDQERFNAGNLLLERDLLGLKNIEIENPPTNLFQDRSSLDSYVSNFQYVLMTKQKNDNPATRNIVVFEQIETYIKTASKPVIKEYTLPNKNILMLYKISE